MGGGRIGTSTRGGESGHWGPAAASASPSAPALPTPLSSAWTPVLAHDQVTTGPHLLSGPGPKRTGQTRTRCTPTTSARGHAP